MNKIDLSHREIRNKLITPAIQQAEWHLFREEIKPHRRPQAKLAAGLASINQEQGNLF